MKSIALVSFVACSALSAFAQSAGSSIANLSSLGQVGAGAGSLIAGFVVEGTVAKNVLVRGTGPGLAAFGVANPAAGVGVNVYDSTGNLVATNSGFQNDPNFATTEQTASQLGAFPLSDPGDSEVLVSLPPGSYSIEIAPNAADAPDGSALLEAYDADAPGSGSLIVNQSSRGQIGANAGHLISGFVINGSAPKNILVRGVGPDLTAFGEGNPAASVDINIYDANGNLVASNSGYLSDPNFAATAQIASAAGAFALSDPGDSELVVSLPPGAYTVEAVPTSADAPDGVALLEVYDADNAMSATSGN